MRLLPRGLVRQLGAIKRALRFWLYKKAEPDVVNRFHKLYYQARERGLTWGDTHWLNTQVLKCPLDLHIYQEIICNVRPDLIIETGTYKGGSALFLASICDLISAGQVVSIDIKFREGRPEHNRITYLTGSSTSGEIVSKVSELVQGCKHVMVILDSAHEKDYVANELRLYSPLVTVGSYLVVEDTHLNGNPIRADFGAGPKEAVEEFLRRNPSFQVDPIGSKLLMTFNPGGCLVRVRE